MKWLIVLFVCVVPVAAAFPALEWVEPHRGITLDAGLAVGFHTISSVASTGGLDLSTDVLLKDLPRMKVGLGASAGVLQLWNAQGTGSSATAIPLGAFFFKPFQDSRWDFLAYLALRPGICLVISSSNQTTSLDLGVGGNLGFGFLFPIATGFNADLGVRSDLYYLISGVFAPAVSMHLGVNYRFPTGAK